MSQVAISFNGYTPPARYDEQPWTLVRIEEATGSSGPWTQIDELPIDPVDDDPTDPQPRSFTTKNGSAGADLWYRVIFADDDGVVSQPSTPVRNSTAVASRRDLCTLADVTSYVPAYTSDDTTDAKLQQLITAESELIISDTGRELIGPDGVATRQFEISESMARRRIIPIGDLDGLYDPVVALLNPDGTTAQVIDADDIVPLYDGLRQPTNEWEPITELQFLATVTSAPVLLPGFHVLEVVARWGFPEVPAFIREACAKRVILRYVSDVATAGTDFAQAVGESDLNLAAMFESAQDAIDQVKSGGGVVIA